MKRKTTARRVTPAATTPRTVVLASLGAVSMGRGKLLDTYSNVIATASALRETADDQVTRLSKNVQARLNPTVKTATVLIKRLRARAEASVQPALRKLGMVAAVKAKKTVTKRAPAKRARKAA